MSNEIKVNYLELPSSLTFLNEVKQNVEVTCYPYVGDMIYILNCTLIISCTQPLRGTLKYIADIDRLTLYLPEQTPMTLYKYTHPQRDRKIDIKVIDNMYHLKYNFYGALQGVL